MPKYAITLALAGVLAACATSEDRYPAVPAELDDVQFGTANLGNRAYSDPGFFFQDMPPGGGAQFLPAIDAPVFAERYGEIGVNTRGYREFFRLDDFAIWRTDSIVPLPDSVGLFQISPGLFLLNPHRHRIKNPDDAVLVDDQAFMGHKNGGDKKVFFELFEAAQKKLGPGQNYEDFQADKPAPETTWTPTPEDASLWQRAKADMDKLAKALGSYHTEHGEYPEALHDLRPYFQRQILPQDPFRGTYYRYQLAETGYELTCYGKGDKPGGEEVPDKDIVTSPGG